jgi:hypothetical protein
MCDRKGAAPSDVGASDRGREQYRHSNSTAPDSQSAKPCDVVEGLIANALRKTTGDGRKKVIRIGVLLRAECASPDRDPRVVNALVKNLIRIGEIDI